MTSSTSSLSSKVGSPSKSGAVASHQAVCSGRLLLASATARSAKRATTMNWLSAVTPLVAPTKPSATGFTSDAHASPRAFMASASLTFPVMTCTYMAAP